MTNFKSATQWFAAHHNKQVNKTVSGVHCIEDWPDMLANYTAQLLAQGCAPENIKVTDGCLTWGGNQFVMIPKIKRHDSGLLTVRSADYSFTGGDGRAIHGMIVTFEGAEP
jgi:hypothetical protein